MASLRQEILIEAPAEVVWDVLRDVGAVHRRLLPGRVVATRSRRLAYAVVEGARPPAEFHHAAFEVLSEGSGASRLIWITDVLPHALANVIRVRMERGIQDMKEAIEAAPRP